MVPMEVLNICVPATRTWGVAWPPWEISVRSVPSTIHSTEVNVSQEEASVDDPESNDQVVPNTLEHKESKVLDSECLLEDPEGNDKSTKGW